jgi:hypothetical protein
MMMLNRLLVLALAATSDAALFQKPTSFGDWDRVEAVSPDTIVKYVIGVGGFDEMLCSTRTSTRTFSLSTI